MSPEHYSRVPRFVLVTCELVLVFRGGALLSHIQMATCQGQICKVIECCAGTHSIELYSCYAAITVIWRSQKDPCEVCVNWSLGQVGSQGYMII